MVFPSGYRRNFYMYNHRRDKSTNSQFNVEISPILQNKRDTRKLALIIASTLFSDSLTKLRNSTKRIELIINTRSPVHRDVTILKEYRREIKQFRKILKLRRKIIKQEITKLKDLQKLTIL